MITLATDAIVACGIAFVMAVISVEDCNTFKIRNNKVVWIGLMALMYRIVAQIDRAVGRTYSSLEQLLEPMIQGLMGIVIVALPMLLLATYFKIPIGGGDIKLTAALGLYVGWQGSIWIMMLSCIAACVAYGIKAVGTPGLVGLKTKIPMGLYTHIGYTIFICYKLLSPGP